MKAILLFVFLLFFKVVAFAQQFYSGTAYPLLDFRNPLDIQPALSGSFGEIRANHFHSGLDFRTMQRTGFPVYASAEGRVARLRVQNSGFGLAIYLDHPKGYTTVYGHLLRFAPRIAKLVKDIQYQKKSYEIDEFFIEKNIIVQKGEVIAYSGNSGISGGPHLHFEIRDTKTEETLNPQLLGINIPDKIPPVIHGLYVYQLNGQAFNELTPKQSFVLTGGNGQYQLKNNIPLHLGGEIGFGIAVNDKHNGASGNNGVYAIELKLDDDVIYNSALERFSFANSRAINSHIDYPSYLKYKQQIQKSFVDPGNPLQIYYRLVNRGRIRFDKNQLHQLSYTITDAAGNKSTLNFQVQADPSFAKPTTNLSSQAIVFPYQQVNSFENKDFKIRIAEGSLYNNLDFTYEIKNEKLHRSYSKLIQIQNRYTPLHKAFELSIKADSSIIPYKDKALVLNQSGQSQGGTYENGWVKANVRNFGSFYVSIDTVAPVIIPLEKSTNQNFTGKAKLAFKIADALSGIKSFEGYIDGQWVLMEFDAKSALLWHSFDDRTQAGKHQFELFVKDWKDNQKIYRTEFYR